MSERERGRQAELRAERIRWRGRSRSMSQASRHMGERLSKMKDQASALDKRLKSSQRGKQEMARDLG